MTRNYMEMDLCFRMGTGFLIGTGYGNQRANQMAVRDHLNQFTLPATSIKGRLRYHMTLFQALFQQDGIHSETTEVVSQLFGSESQRGRLFFDAGRLPDNYSNWESSELRTGIRIERFTGSTADKSLRFYETGAPGLTFHTRIEGWLKGGVHGHELNFLLGALRLIRKIGAGKSRGLGRCYVELVALRLGDSSYGSDQLEGFLETYVSQQLGEVVP